MIRTKNKLSLQKMTWAKRNPEKVREQSKKYYENNREKRLQTNRKYYLINREKIVEKTRKKYAEDKEFAEKVKQYSRNYQKRRLNEWNSLSDKEQKYEIWELAKKMLEEL